MQHSESPNTRDEGDSQSSKGSKSWMRFAGLGMELAGYTLSIAAVGFFFDKHRGHATPYATAFGALVGFAYGMYRFIRQASEGLDD